MTHRVLEELKSDELELQLSFVSNPRAIHHALQRNSCVRKVRSAMNSGEVTEDTIRQFCAKLLRELRFGSRFEHEFALAAIAVALETRVTSFADEFILDLARLELAEMPVAIRVARVACQERLKLPANQTKLFSWSDQEPLQVDWQRAQNLVVSLWTRQMNAFS